MRTLYLDQNHWIYLGQAAQGRPRRPEHLDALEVIREGVDRGVLRCPLSAQHYMETMKRRDAGSRNRLGRLMFEVSARHTIAPPAQVVPAELDSALHRRYGKPFDRRPLRLFGSGVAFAFGQEDNLQGSGSDQFDPVIPLEQRVQLAALLADAVELFALTGPPEGPVPGLSGLASYRFDERYAEGERAFAKMLATEEGSAELKVGWIAASEMMDIIEPLNEALDRAHITKVESADLEGPDGLTGLLHDLPSRWVVHELRRQRHANRETKWKANDLNDLGALSVAIAYCDVVVTERLWTHLARQAHLDVENETFVVSDLADVPALIV